MKNKKLTYNELANYLIQVEERGSRAINTIGQTLTDFIKFIGKEEEFLAFLKEKYEPKKEKKDT